ncbi:MAG: TonB family protein [Bacteroidota bacterium]
MLNTKLNLYNPEWLELVFTDRNKKYGAFELRQHYGSTMIRAMAIGLTAVVAAAVLYNVSVKKVIEKIPTVFEEHVVRLNDLKLEKPVEPKLEASKQHPPVSTMKYTSFVVTNKPIIEEPPVITELTEAIGPTTVKGENTAPVENVIASSNGKGSGPEPVVDNTIHNTGTLESMPEPIGGTGAWNKFLSKNLRFPSQAQEEGKGGRVLVSFVIEKDGHLSDISIQNGAGYGMDEEALRVLKLAKPWKPGVQNGQPVRVRYVIPLNFQINEQ